MDTERTRQDISNHLDDDPDSALYVDFNEDTINIVRAASSSDDAYGDAIRLLAGAVFNLHLDFDIPVEVAAEQVMNRAQRLRARANSGGMR